MPCLTVEHGARFAVRESMSQSEVGCLTVGHWALLCLTVGRGVRFAVPESMAQGEVCCA